MIPVVFHCVDPRMQGIVNEHQKPPFLFTLPGAMADSEKFAKNIALLEASPQNPVEIFFLTHTNCKAVFAAGTDSNFDYLLNNKGLKDFKQEIEKQTTEEQMLYKANQELRQTTINFYQAILKITIDQILQNPQIDQLIENNSITIRPHLYVHGNHSHDVILEYGIKNKEMDVANITEKPTNRHTGVQNFLTPQANCNASCASQIHQQEHNLQSKL